MMKEKLNSRKGFTLAELLIVVAIIAVLVAIAIPVFGAELENAKEAVDASAIRAAYAEVMVDAVSGETGTITRKVTLTQDTSGWQKEFDFPKNLKPATSPAAVDPSKGTEVTITYDKDLVIDSATGEKGGCTINIKLEKAS